MAWITPQEAADHVGAPVDDPRLLGALAAVVAEIERVRSDLDFTTGPPDSVKFGALLWVTDLYQTKNAPSGFPNYGEPGADLFGPIEANRWVTISRLCGLRRPVAL